VTPSRSVTSLVLLGFPSLIRLRRPSLVAKGRLTERTPRVAGHMLRARFNPEMTTEPSGAGFYARMEMARSKIENVRELWLRIQLPVVSW